MRKISLVLMMLMLIPMFMSVSVAALTPEQERNYVIVNVYDGMTNDPLKDVNIDVYGDGDYICTVYRTDINGSYITKERFSEGQLLILYVLHNDYYMYTYEYVVPTFSFYGNSPTFSCVLFKKGTNVTTSLPGIYSNHIGPADLGFRFTLEDGDCMFGAGVMHDIRRDNLVKGPALILRSEEPLDILNYDEAWQTLSGFHYLFDISTIYNDLDNPTDGDIAENVGIVFSGDFNISATVVEGYVESDLFKTYTGSVCLIYASGMLTYTQKYALELYDDFATTYTLEYTVFTDLVITDTDTTPVDTGPTEYTLTELTVIGGMALVVVIAFVLMMNQASKRNKRAF